VAPHINTLDIKDFQWAKINGKWQVQNTPLGDGMVDFNRFFKLLYQANVKKETPICLHFEYDLGGADKGAKTITVAPAVVKSAMKRDLAFLKNLLQTV
jgi:L-ribulose-5-phosphate 3-epimerase UlaE